MQGLCLGVLSVVEFSLPVAVGLSFLSTSPSSGFDGRGSLGRISSALVVIGLLFPRLLGWCALGSATGGKHVSAISHSSTFPIEIHKSGIVTEV